MFYHASNWSKSLWWKCFPHLGGKVGISHYPLRNFSVPKMVHLEPIICSNIFVKPNSTQLPHLKVCYSVLKVKTTFVMECTLNMIQFLLRLTQNIARISTLNYKFKILTDKFKKGFRIN